MKATKHKRFWMTVLALTCFLGLLVPVPPASQAAADSLLAPQAGRRSKPRERSKPAEKGKEQAGQEQQESEPEVDLSQEEPIQLGARLVTVPVVVFDKKGNLYLNMKKENFAIYEDNVRQEIITFSDAEAPLTMVMLIEYSKIIQWIREEVIYPAGIFVTRFFRPGDYVAMVAYDIRPKVLVDFTNNPNDLMGGVNILIRNLPAFSEANLFDSLKFVLEGGELDGEHYSGLQEVKGRTSILLVATGIDTFSKINYDQARKIVARGGVPIYSIGVGEVAYIRAEPYLSGPQRLTFLQAQNQLRTFSDTTGGRFYSVRFLGALPSVLESITTMLRHQYVLGYTPSNPRAEGKKRKIKLEVDVDGDGKDDSKRLEVQYREFYIEPEGNDKS